MPVTYDFIAELLGPPAPSGATPHQIFTVELAAGTHDIATLGVPADTDVEVTLWGGGAPGAGNTGTGIGYGGGGAGGYAQGVIGAGLWALGGSLVVGGQSQPTVLTIDGNDELTADQGLAGTLAAGGTGGTSSAGAGPTDTVLIDGADGAAGAGTVGGKGGRSPGSGGGNGGAGGSGTGVVGAAGVVPGGGGGGGGADEEPGAGAAGRARLRWPPPGL